jgi:L-ascorbate metabolism protein UlaG (beta-lactamase superfamily)
LLPGADPCAAAAASGLRVTFFGVSTLLLDDGQTALMTDGFFSRPGLFRIMRSKIEPDVAVIEQSLERAGIRSLAAVMPVHSHYDHALDSPAVAQKTGAQLVGSPSTANIGRGYGLAEDRIKIVNAPETLIFGRFNVTFIESRHSPHALYAGEITSPVTPPAAVSRYEAGECFSLFIEWGGRTLLVHASAGFIPEALRGRKADVIFLGVGTLGKLGARYQEKYWREVVRATGAWRVILVHWDDFWKPLSEPLVPQPRFMDDFDNTMRFMLARGHAENVDVRIPPAWVVSDPFAR